MDLQNLARQRLSESTRYWSSEEDSLNHGTALSSLVAVHGLNGTVLKTWTDPTTQSLWLRDFLPEAIPNSRIMSYGYNSAAAFSLSTASIDDFATDLLNRIRGKRQHEDVSSFVQRDVGQILHSSNLTSRRKRGHLFSSAIA